MGDYISSLQYITSDGLNLVGRDDIDYHVRVRAYSDDDYFEDTNNNNEQLNTISFDTYTFAGSDIKTLKLHYEIGLLTDALAVDTLTADVTFPGTVAVSRYTAITVRRGDRVVGVFYNGQIKQTGQNQYQIYAESAVSLLDYDYHNGGVYAGETAGSVITGLMGSVPYTINGDVAAIRLYGYLPRATKRSNLQQVILATGAAIRRGDGGLDITVLPNDIVGTLGDDAAFEGAGVESDTIVTSLQVTEHSYLPSGETATLCEDTFVGSKEIVFDEPMHTLTCTGGDILDSSANHATINGRGPVVLTGKKYIHTTKIISKGDAGAGDDKIYTVSDATLINPLNSAAVADRLYKYAVCNKTIKQDVLISTERPGDLVTVIDPHKPGQSLSAAIQSLDYSLSNTVRASGTFLVGYEPAGIATGYKNRVLLINTSTWVVPAGVTNIRAVLIGGGAAGSTGEAGGAGGKGANKSSPGTGVSGLGGAGGAGGSGGKSISVILDVVPGAALSAAIGAGGTVSTLPGNTALGEATTQNGEYGVYVDILTGDRYAVNGEIGLSGVPGGQGGSFGPNHDWYSAGRPGTGESLKISGVGTIRGHGGGGGGAAYGGNGQDGANGSVDYNNKLGSADGGNGGAGAAATVTGLNATIPGSGGHGGHGGGGGGGGGDTYHPNPQDYAWPGRGGAGGSGSAGGNGAPGCVIIYY